ncbi:MAG: R3H domain-containing nucleic acid-binding protein, partial [Chloroflexota bacterium]
VGTAHGNTLENLMMNPTLADLIGGIQTVTLGDEEAKRRGTQKSVLERMAPPTFNVVVEIQDRDRVAIHSDVSTAVDASLRGQPAATEVRWLNQQGEVQVEKSAAPVSRKPARVRPPAAENRPPRLYLFGTNQGRLEQLAKERQLSLEVVNDLKAANLFVTTKSYYRRKPQKLKEAEAAGIPLYVLKSNTPPQMRQLLQNLYPTERVERPDSLKTALAETARAIDTVQSGQETAAPLSPQNAYIRRLQHLLAQRHHVGSRSQGREPDRRVIISKE